MANRKLASNISVTLNENFHFTRPLTVTGAYLVPDRHDGRDFIGLVFFHQMVLDRIDNEEYVIHNTSFDEGGPVLRIPITRAYYVNGDVMFKNSYGPDEFKFYGDKGVFMWLVNERFKNMQPNTWYLCPQAYSLTLEGQGTSL